MSTTEQLNEWADKIAEFAARKENYEAGWDVIVEATTRKELLEMISGDTDEEYQNMRSMFPDYPRVPPAPNYKEAKRRVQRIVDLHEEQRQEIESTIW